jgi:hypothetical protein
MLCLGSLLVSLVWRINRQPWRPESPQRAVPSNLFGSAGDEHASHLCRHWGLSLPINRGGFIHTSASITVRQRHQAHRQGRIAAYA